MSVLYLAQSVLGFIRCDLIYILLGFLLVPSTLEEF